MGKLLSISVAAYNIEQWIGECLDSFLPEEIRSRVEVIVTDDGSSDKTREIAAEYAKRYPDTFRLVCQKNAGPGSTVNSGLRHASGTYFRMVDGDDWVNRAGTAKLLDFLETSDADMVCCGYCSVHEKTGERTVYGLPEELCGKKLPVSEVIGKLDPGMHNVVYRTALLRDNGVVLDNGFYTDMEYLLFPMMAVETIALLNETVYMYRIGDESQSMSIKSLQRREDEHLSVLRHLVGRYGTYRRQEKENTQLQAFLARKIAGMAGTQLSIYLSFADTARYRDKTRAMTEWVRGENAEIYGEMLKLKSFRLLEMSGYRLYAPLAWFHKKKLGI